jgi:hypothetical protein
MRGFDLRFEDIARNLQERRLSRRSALAQGAGGLAGGAVALAGLRGGVAQDTDATPTPATGEKTTYLFVQSFQAGSVAPADGGFGTHTVTLEQGWGQTIYFADRPSRDVGAGPTSAFLDGLGFEPENPPNAALIVETAPGETDVAVVELFNPTYDESTHTATYDIAVLANWQDTAGSLQEAPVDLDGLAAEFGTAHLLIDDCADRRVQCLRDPKPGEGIHKVECGWMQETGFCFRWDQGGCVPCEPDYHDKSQPISRTEAYWAKACNETFRACEGNCIGWWGTSLW